MKIAIKANKHLPKPFTKPVTAYEFFLRLIEIMKEEPTRVDQGDWLRTGTRAVHENWDTQKHCEIKRPGPACGTVGCTAGWASVLLGYKQFPTSEVIAEDLGLKLIDNGYSACADELFDSSGYNNHVEAPSGTAKHMQQVTKGIREFMQDHKGALKRILVFPKAK